MSILDFKSGSSASHPQDEGLQSFHCAVTREYGQFDEDNLFDMATGETFPHECMVMTHIFQSRWQKFLPLFTSSTDINGVANSLMLYKPVAWAFNRGKICIQIDSVGRMSFHLFDGNLRDINLAHKAHSLQITSRLADEVVGGPTQLDLTFGDLDGRELCFPVGSMMRPSKRLLAVHAYAAWLKAWALDPSIEFPIPQYNFSDEETNSTKGQALDFIIEQWRIGVQRMGLHATPLVSKPC